MPGRSPPWSARCCAMSRMWPTRRWFSSSTSDRSSASPGAASVSVTADGGHVEMKLAHVGLPARDPDRLAAFYTGFLGLSRVARVTTEQTGEMVLLSGRPQEQPQELALLSNPQARHVAF